MKPDLISCELMDFLRLREDEREAFRQTAQLIRPNPLHKRHERATLSDYRRSWQSPEEKAFSRDLLRV